MTMSRAQIITGAAVFLTALGVAYSAGHAEATPERVDVQVIHEESGEVDSLTVYHDGTPVPAETHTAWRGNDDSPTGLYYTDPTPDGALAPVYSTDGTGAVVTVTRSNDDESAVVDVVVTVGGEQIPVDHISEIAAEEG